MRQINQKQILPASRSQATLTRKTKHPPINHKILTTFHSSLSHYPSRTDRSFYAKAVAKRDVELIPLSPFYANRPKIYSENERGKIIIHFAVRVRSVSRIFEFPWEEVKWGWLLESRDLEIVNKGKYIKQQSCVSSIVL